MILKAGTYKFNEVLTETSPFSQDINCTVITNDLTIEVSNVKSSIEEEYIDPDTFEFYALSIIGVPKGESTNETLIMYVNPVPNNSVYQTMYPDGWIGGQKFSIDIPTDTEVDDTFGTWVISNTNYNEVNGIVETKPLGEITYNGETIAQLNAGETATLSCEGMKMASDVVVKVNEVESKIPEGYIKPEGTLELVFNNIEAEFPIDCSQYAKVTVNTAEPLKITDPTVLDNITDSPWGVGGSVFLYEGATTDSYENGTLYYLEDTEK